MPPILLSRPLDGPLPAPIWPPGVALAPAGQFSPEQLHALLVAGYAQGGGTAGECASWWTALVNDSEYDPELVFVAVSGEEPIGLCQCWTSAFIKDLVVLPQWRGKGVGSALVLTALAAFAARGAAAVALKVEAGNSKAQALYAQLGFQAPT